MKPFLAATKSWADKIVVADQGSTDGTLELARSTPGVEAVINDSSTFDEVHRQRLLLNTARRIPGKRILIALDADEALSANARQSREWDQIAEARPGTVLRFRWVNILPGFKRAWIPPTPLHCGLVDDGTEHGGKPIHNPRVPWPTGAPVLDLQEIVVLHFQYVVWERVFSKQRWYQVWEYLNNPQQTPLQIFRQYHHMFGSWDASEIHDVQPDWLEGYDRVGVDYRSLACEPVTWWDREMVRLLNEHGPERFRKLAIWDADWNALARRLGVKGRDLTDPRSAGEKAIHSLLRNSQGQRSTWWVRLFERFLRRTAW